MKNGGINSGKIAPIKVALPIGYGAPNWGIWASSYEDGCPRIGALRWGPLSGCPINGEVGRNGIGHYYPQVGT